MAPGPSRLELVLIRDEIQQLAYRYAWLLDSRDLEGLADLFVDDVRVAPGVTGREALRDSFAASLRGIGPTTLFVGNHLVDVHDADHASGVVYCRGYIAEPDGFAEQMIVYTDRYERRATDGAPDGAFLFVGRRHELVYGVRTAEQPFAQEPANWPERSVGVGTLPFRLDSWRRFHETPASPPDGHE